MAVSKLYALPLHIENVTFLDAAVTVFRIALFSVRVSIA